MIPKTISIWLSHELCYGVYTNRIRWPGNDRNSRRLNCDFRMPRLPLIPKSASMPDRSATGAISLVRLKPRENQASLSKNGAEFLGVREKKLNSSLNSQNSGLVAAGERRILQGLLIEEEKKKVPWTALGSLNPVSTMKSKTILNAG